MCSIPHLSEGIAVRSACIACGICMHGGCYSRTMGRLASSRFALREEKRREPSLPVCHVRPFIRPHNTWTSATEGKENQLCLGWSQKVEGGRIGGRKFQRVVCSGQHKLEGKLFFFFLRDLRTIVIPGPFGKKRNESCKNYLID